MGSSDIRIKVGTPRHYKFRRLKKKLGGDGCWAWLTLACHVGDNRPSGDLAGMSDEDIADAAEWEGETDDLIEALLEVKLLDQVDGHLVMHDWPEHNPWAAGSDARSEAARLAGLASGKARRTGGKRTNSETRSTDPESRSTEYETRSTGSETRLTPTPSPTPSPTPKPEATGSPAPAHTRESFPPPGATATAYQIAVAQDLNGWQSETFAKIADAHPCKTDMDRAAAEFRKRIATMHDAGVALKHHAAWLAEPTYSGRNRALQWYFTDGTWRNPPASPVEAKAPGKRRLNSLVDLAIVRKLTDFDPHAWGNAGPLEDQRTADREAWIAADAEAERRIRERKAQGLNLMGALS